MVAKKALKNHETIFPCITSSCASKQLITNV